VFISRPEQIIIFLENEKESGYSTDTELFWAIREEGSQNAVLLALGPNREKADRFRQCKNAKNRNYY
jgi:hypothetical protein